MSHACMKHFTDAELAAEYWNASDHERRIGDAARLANPKMPALHHERLIAAQKELYRMLTLYRFATHPHALEPSHD